MPGGAGTRVDPIVSNAFYLEIPGYDQVGSFQEISGLDSETDVSELWQSTKGGKVVVIKTQGQNLNKPGKLTVKYAAFKGDPLLKWRKEVTDGKMTEARKNCTLISYTVDDAASLKFNFTNCWPSKYSYSTLSTKSTDPVSVTVTIEFEQMDIVNE